MIIDKVGGLSPNYGQRGPKEVSESRGTDAQDRVNISQEASRAAELARIADIAKTGEDPERLEKLELVREKLANQKYDNLSEEQLQTITNSLMQSFLG